MLLLIFWLTMGILSVGVAGFHFLFMIGEAKKPWLLKMKDDYFPNISIIIPTFNEAPTIGFKLLNLIRMDYPKSLLQFIVSDSESEDGTLDLAKKFAAEHADLNFLFLSVNEKGKSAALDLALKHAQGHVVVISDADCFYPSDILRKSVPYLSDEKVGAISGPKIIINEKTTQAVRSESRYLNLMNLVKLGESKLGFTPLFEGGFSAFRKEIFQLFDPYQTGSDDSGSIIRLAENSLSALFVPEATFFTTFPTEWSERLGIKLRRANQLVRVFANYLNLLLKSRIKITRRVIIVDAFMYLFSPIFFMAFLLTTFLLFIYYPYLLFFLAVFLVPKVGPMLVEVFQSYLILFVSLVGVGVKRKFLTWRKPRDRYLLTEEVLRHNNLI